MTKDDLQNCARPHATSKISTEVDLMNLSTLGFRGEALASVAAVARLSIISGGWKMRASITEDHILEQTAETAGTIVQAEGLFENFPARRQFLKRPSTEGMMCKNTFVEKAMARPDIAFRFIQDGVTKLDLPAGQTLKERFVAANNYREDSKLFYQFGNSSAESADDENPDWSFEVVIGEPSVSRTNKKDIFIYANGRRVQEYSLVQAVEYGGQGYFPNGTYPVAAVFVHVKPDLVDFNIHPAKREARFYDISGLHHGLSSTIKSFFLKYTRMNFENNKTADDFGINEFDFTPDSSSFSTPSYSDSSNLSGDAATAAVVSPNISSSSTGGTPTTGKKTTVVQNNEYENHYVSMDYSSLSANGNTETVISHDNELEGKSANSSSLNNSSGSENRLDKIGTFAHANSKITYKDNVSSVGLNDFRSKYLGKSSSHSDSATASGSSSPASSASSNKTASSFTSAASFTSTSSLADAALRAGSGFKYSKPRYIGACLGTFLLAEKDRCLYIIDQHAVHERILFDKLMSTQTKAKSQQLLIPYKINTESKTQDKLLENLAPELTRIGFETLKKEDGKWEIISIPERWTGTEYELKNLIFEKQIEPKEIIRSIAAMTSCKAAIKDGYIIDDITATELVEKAFELADPHCPHGRPIYTVISREKLFELVKRT